MEWDGTDILQERWIQDKELQDMEEYIKAEDLKAGDLIYQEDGHGNPIEASVVRVRRINHEDCLVALKGQFPGEIRVPLAHVFKVLNR